MPAHCKSAHRTDVMTVVSPHFSSLPSPPSNQSSQNGEKEFLAAAPPVALFLHNVALHAFARSVFPTHRGTQRAGEWRRYTTNHFPRLSPSPPHSRPPPSFLSSPNIPPGASPSPPPPPLRSAPSFVRTDPARALLPPSPSPSLLRVPLQDHLNFRNPDLLGWASLLQLIPRAESICLGPLFQPVKADQQS